MDFFKKQLEDYVIAVGLYESFLLALHAILAGYAEDCQLNKYDWE